jgi:hypothetical protein
MTGYHTRWVRPPEQAEDPEQIAIREALAFGKAVYDQRCVLGLSVADLAGRAGMLVATTVTDRNAHCGPGFQYPPLWLAD